LVEGTESLAELKARITAMEQEVEDIERKEKLAEKQLGTKSSNTIAAGEEVDARSVYVGNVDYSTKPDELKKLFAQCGVVERITILCDKWTGQPKGFAYVQFSKSEDIENAILLQGTEFKGRVIKVSQKRTNIPGYNTRGRGRFRGYRRSRYRPRYRSRFRRRPRSHFSPYNMDQ